MNDTTPEVARIYRDLLMSRSGAERFRMGCEMFDAAKAFALAGLRARGEEEIPESLFLRMYGSDFSEEDRSRIVAVIKAKAGAHGTPYDGTGNTTESIGRPAAAAPATSTNHRAAHGRRPNDKAG